MKPENAYTISKIKYKNMFDTICSISCFPTTACHQKKVFGVNKQENHLHEHELKLSDYNI